jgi:hypothetical protein
VDGDRNRRIKQLHPVGRQFCDEEESAQNTHDKVIVGGTIPRVSGQFLNIEYSE